MGPNSTPSFAHITRQQWTSSHRSAPRQSASVSRRWARCGEEVPGRQDTAPTVSRVWVCETDVKGLESGLDGPAHRTTRSGGQRPGNVVLHHAQQHGQLHLCPAPCLPPGVPRECRAPRPPRSSTCEREPSHVIRPSALASALPHGASCRRRPDFASRPRSGRCGHPRRAGPRASSQRFTWAGTLLLGSHRRAH